MIDSLKRMFDTIRKECDFRTVDDYNKFMELGIGFLEKFKEVDDYDFDMIIDLQEKVERYEKALEQISQIGYSDKFGGGWTYTGEYHARCMKIAMETLKKPY